MRLGVKRRTLEPMRCGRRDNRPRRSPVTRQLLCHAVPEFETGWPRCCGNQPLAPTRLRPLHTIVGYASCGRQPDRANETGRQNGTEQLIGVGGVAPPREQVKVL